MAKFYCEYCGGSHPSILSLTANACGKHPAGHNRGKHKLYEGGEKPKYTCKYCGVSHSSILSLTANACGRHPEGHNKGSHSPAL
jgi:hypothetical protein